MSDTSTSIVPAISNYKDGERKAKEIVKWLIEIKAIKAEKTDCILSSDLGYPIDIGAQKLTNSSEYLPYGLITNGLDVITERTIFHTGQNGLDSICCPNCKANLNADDWGFIDNYYETGNSILACFNCNKDSDLNDYLIEPAWGFSNLGFTFWNWTDFKSEFVEEFEKRLRCKVKVVESHI